MLPAAFGLYVCPRCRGHLCLPDDRGLRCGPCKVAYPLVQGIPDFISQDLEASPHPILRRLKVFDWLSLLYDIKPFYPLALKIYAGLRVSYFQVLRVVTDMVAGASGLILDVATGPGTLGRRLAGPLREVYGIDASWGMLRQGAARARREGLGHLHLARALAEALPFPEGCFAAALCGTALHLLADPLQGLREISRTLKPGAPLAVTTIMAGDTGLLKFRALREHLRKAHGMHVFTVAGLEQLTAQAGLGDFQPQVFGSLLAFRVWKMAS